MLRSTWFLAVVAVVLGVGASVATLMMRMGTITEATPEAAPTVIPEFGAPPALPKARNWDFWTDEVQTLVNELKAKRQELDARAKDLDAYAERLSTEKQELVKVRSELEGLRDELDKFVPVIQQSETVNLKTLSKTYAAMKPSQAVSIMSEMDDATIVKLLALMKPEGMAAVFQEMARPAGGMAARAARISDQIRLLKKQATETAPAQ